MSKSLYLNPRPCDTCPKNITNGGKETGCMCTIYKYWFKQEWDHVCAPFRALKKKEQASS